MVEVILVALGTVPRLAARLPSTAVDAAADGADRRRAAAWLRPARARGAAALRAGPAPLANGPDDIGAMDLYFLLASRLPTAVALRAADAWGNGRDLVTEREDHTICADLVFTGRDPARRAAGSATPSVSGRPPCRPAR